MVATVDGKVCYRQRETHEIMSKAVLCLSIAWRGKKCATPSTNQNAESHQRRACYLTSSGWEGTSTLCYMHFSPTPLRKKYTLLGTASGQAFQLMFRISVTYWMKACYSWNITFRRWTFWSWSWLIIKVAFTSTEPFMPCSDEVTSMRQFDERLC